VSGLIRGFRCIAGLCLAWAVGLGVPSSLSLMAAMPDKPPAPATATPRAPRKELFAGRVVVLRDALRRRGITAFDEFADQIVLETPTAELIPIVPDWRGRAFFQDPRLRNRRVELVGYRRKGIPYLQVLMVFTFDKHGARQYTDYWCEICAIPMYEIKPCDCCQAEIDLRFQPRDLPLYLRTDPKKEAAAPSNP